MEKLLTRDEFRENCLSRDKGLCVVCGEKGVDVHHIIERRLFPDGGYYMGNGATLCSECHLKAESTELSCGEIREAVGIKDVVLPPHLYRDQPYDKWGNPVLPNGTRLKGELFEDESVQKIIKPVLSLFVQYVKYPRTYHLPWSPGMTKDDKQIKSASIFEGKRVIVTEKMDGENTTMYRDYCHARSLEFEPHPSRNWAKALHAQVSFEIPEGWRVCCENVYARHSIEYKNLKSYVYLFSIWNDKNICLSWDETVDWAKLLGMEHVEVLYDGIWDEKKMRDLYVPEKGGQEIEGYVVRLAEEFHYSQFRNSVAKYVRENHVTSIHNWKFQQVIPNKLEQ